jgi:hypothetical protein
VEQAVLVEVDAPRRLQLLAGAFGERLPRRAAVLDARRQAIRGASPEHHAIRGRAHASDLNAEFLADARGDLHVPHRHERLVILVRAE